ncbi:hypothetical protein LZ32DRAFT_600184 [Colletotrichum eremochloae]|nr:hypothetical protein LZ32DRAFT_600184 [Colletotrichum eremochloae]
MADHCHPYPIAERGEGPSISSCTAPAARHITTGERNWEGREDGEMGVVTMANRAKRATPMMECVERPRCPAPHSCSPDMMRGVRINYYVHRIFISKGKLGAGSGQYTSVEAEPMLSKNSRERRERVRVALNGSGRDWGRRGSGSGCGRRKRQEMLIAGMNA